MAPTGLHVIPSKGCGGETHLLICKFISMTISFGQLVHFGGTWWCRGDVEGIGDTREFLPL